MCFATLLGTEPKIAEEDIICYKDTWNKCSWLFFQSPFYKKHFYIRGFRKRKIELVPMANKYSLMINKGYHSYIQKPWGDKGGVFKIPKGTKYYENQATHERVSETLVYLGKISQ